MFKIYANGTLLSPFPAIDKNHYIYDPTISFVLNDISKFTFKIHNDHPKLNNIAHRTTYIQVYDDTEELFRGRIVKTDSDFYNTGKVYVEHELAFLKDSVYRPFGFNGGVTEFFTLLINNHNSQVDEDRQFVVGDVTVTDPNDYIVRSSNAAVDTWTLIQDKLIDLLGGYVRTRVKDGIRYIDYIEDYGEITGQTVEFKKNLLNLNQQKESAEVITCLIPYGAMYSDGDAGYEEEPANGEWNGNRLTISAVNNGVDYIESEAGIALWGRVWGTEVWDDVTLAPNLLTKAKARLAEKIAALVSIEATVLDLHLTNADVPRLKIGYRVNVYSPPHNLKTQLRISKQTLYLDSPDRDKITLGESYQSFTKHKEA